MTRWQNVEDAAADRAPSGTTIVYLVLAVLFWAAGAFVAWWLW
jgi:hypothetical protein